MDIEKFPDDMNENERKVLAKYIQNGCADISTIDEAKVLRMFSLYMSGKNYIEICDATAINKDIVLYLSHKFKWYDQKMSHYQAISELLIQKIHLSKIEAADTISRSIVAMSKYLNKKFDNYINRNDDSVIKGPDNKIFVQYHKSIELLDKLFVDSTGRAKPKELIKSIEVPINKEPIVDKTETIESVGNEIKNIDEVKNESEEIQELETSDNLLKQLVKLKRGGK
jgi:hypothetical protein